MCKNTTPARDGTSFFLCLPHPLPSSPNALLVPSPMNSPPPPGLLNQRGIQLIEQKRLRQDPLDWSFWSFLNFLHHSIEEEERHLLLKFHKKTSKEKLVKCATEVARLHKVSIQSCTQNRPSPKVQSRSGD